MSIYGLGEQYDAHEGILLINSLLEDTKSRTGVEQAGLDYRYSIGEEILLDFFEKFLQANTPKGKTPPKIKKPWEKAKKRAEAAKAGFTSQPIKADRAKELLQQMARGQAPKKKG